MAFAALSLAGCSGLDETDVNPDVPLVEKPLPVITYEGSGNLVTGTLEEQKTLQSTYAWEAKDNAIVINIGVDLAEYIDAGGWELGYFFLDLDSINDFLGILVSSDTDESNFYGVEPDGSTVDYGENHDPWTSYKPGMWVDKNGKSTNYSGGTLYWQWYIWTGRQDKNGADIYYDYGEGTDKAYNGLFLVGGNPGNVAGLAAELAGSTTTSKAKMDVNGQSYDFIVNVTYSEYTAEKVATGEGKLKYHNWTSDEEFEVVETNSQYSWRIHENEGVTVNIEVDTEEWSAGGDWEIGFFDDMTAEAFEGVFGFDPGTLDDEAFYATEPDGTKVAWTSYAPGMWIGPDGTSNDWSGGVAYWQWYLRPEQFYDYGYEGNEGLFMIGGNPGNVGKITYDTPFTSKAVISKDGATIPVSITYTFHDVILPEDEGYQNQPMSAGNNGYAYSSGVDGNHQWSWYFCEDGLFVDIDLVSTADEPIEDWGLLGIVIDPEIMKEYLGIADINQLTDLSYFYPTDGAGNPLTEWTSYAPGQWVTADGDPTGWSDGLFYWQYQFGDNKYDGHFTEGLLVIGVNPGNLATFGSGLAGAGAMMGDKMFVITVNVHDSFPTEKQGIIGPHNYYWELSDGGFEFDANVSLAAKDDSWNWFGVTINPRYINEALGININDATIDDFYPLDENGAAQTSWSSYVPGQWFGADGSVKSWSDGFSFWQYYTTNTYDYEIPSLMLLGNNPSYEFSVGDEGISNSKLYGKDWKVVISVDE